MGQAMSFGLTQYDIDELREHCGNAWSQQELLSLYKRFRTLDKARKGFITSEEILSIPELSINPLARRLEHLFEALNFKEFAYILAAFSSRVDRQWKLKFMFEVWDVDGDGVVGVEDMGVMLRLLGGAAFSEEDVHELIARVLAAAGAAPDTGIGFESFSAAMGGVGVGHMWVEVPVEA